MAAVKKEQLELEVPAAPGAIGRWDADHEISAYRKSMGEDAASRQQSLAAQSRDCTCGQQEKADTEAHANGKSTKKLLGHHHKPGCNSYRKLSQSLGISLTEQAARYRADRLRSALKDARDEGRL